MSFLSTIISNLVFSNLQQKIGLLSRNRSAQKALFELAAEGAEAVCDGCIWPPLNQTCSSLVQPPKKEKAKKTARKPTKEQSDQWARMHMSLERWSCG